MTREFDWLLAAHITVSGGETINGKRFHTVLEEDLWRLIGKAALADRAVDFFRIAADKRQEPLILVSDIAARWVKDYDAI